MSAETDGLVAADQRARTGLDEMTRVRHRPRRPSRRKVNNRALRRRLGPNNLSRG
jgi:hypothetical protein